jgi:hypothetical protein
MFLPIAAHIRVFMAATVRGYDWGLEFETAKIFPVIFEKDIGCS